MTPDLNPARLALFTDWVTTLPPRPLPRTVTPMPGEYHLGYLARLARANHLDPADLAGIVTDTASVTLHRTDWTRHQQQRLATLASQPLPRITRLCWPDPASYLRDIEGFHQRLRPACRRCTARHGITGPVPCQLLPHQTLCRRHRLWTGPAARSHAGQLDISPFPEILRAHRRHHALTRRHPRQLARTATAQATTAIYRAIRDGTHIPGQQHRMRHLAPGTWQQQLADELSARPGRPPRPQPQPPRDRNRDLPRRHLAHHPHPPDPRPGTSQRTMTKQLTFNETNTPHHVSLARATPAHDLTMAQID